MEEVDDVVCQLLWQSVHISVQVVGLWAESRPYADVPGYESVGRRQKS